ncbi:MAG TPA: ABC transporter permease [Gammaproteobacteria bacterium]|nr:ABC transporter permease [Gammaproteobacteria bacterium]
MMGSINFVVLWTDSLIYLLLGMVLLFTLWVRRHEHLRAPWGRVIQRPINVVAILILSTFVCLGLMDSIHFRHKKGIPSQNVNSQEIVSVLDVLLNPIATHQETSYSAPFATHLFTKTAILKPDGSLLRGYPRLQFGGAHLGSVDRKGKDIVRLAALSLIETLVMAAAFTGIAIIIISFKLKKPVKNTLTLILKKEGSFPWRSFFLTLTFIIFCVWFVYNLMPFYHILGTGKVGEDVLYQTLKSIRTGLVIGTLTTLIMLPFAVMLGIMAGYFRGILDDVIQYVYTTLSSIPGVLLIAAAVLTLQVVMNRHMNVFDTMIERQDARLLALCMILGITSWTGLCRLLRGEALKLREAEFVLAAKSLGVGNFKILFRHLLPNVMHIILISVALDFSGLVLAEAVLSYVGVGVDPTTYSWGTMINSARLEMARVPVVWWSLAAAFIFMFTLVLTANIFADALRDAFDPRYHE